MYNIYPQDGKTEILDKEELQWNCAISRHSD